MTKYLDRMQPLALLVLRLVLATIMIAHGSQKVFGGMPRFQGVVSGIGLPAWLAYLSAAAEFGGGILVLLGILTRFAAFAITIDLVVAIVKVHAKAGLRGARRLRVSAVGGGDCVCAHLLRRRADLAGDDFQRPPGAETRTIKRRKALGARLQASDLMT